MSGNHPPLNQREAAMNEKFRLHRTPHGHPAKIMLNGVAVMELHIESHINDKFAEELVNRLNGAANVMRMESATGTIGAYKNGA